MTVGNFKPNSGDFCSYVRNVIWGATAVLLLAGFVTFFGGMLLAGLINIGIYVYDWLFGHPYTITNAFVIAGSFMICLSVAVAAVFAILYFGREAYEKRQENNPNKPDSFIKNAYTSLKNKVCFKVNFTGK